MLIALLLAIAMPVLAGCMLLGIQRNGGIADESGSQYVGL
jgi:hypothetical protein